MWDWIICRCPGQREPCPAEKHSVSVWQPRLVPDWWACAYILDEPSIGLHQRDNDKLLDTLKNLRDLGNTLIVVEHDEDTMLAADYIVDIGPGAGDHGGEVVAAWNGRRDHEDAKILLPAQYLSGRMQIPVPTERAEADRTGLRSQVPQENNLKNIDVEIPLGVIDLCDRCIRIR